MLNLFNSRVLLSYFCLNSAYTFFWLFIILFNEFISCIALFNSSVLSFIFSFSFSSLSFAFLSLFFCSSSFDFFEEFSRFVSESICLTTSFIVFFCGWILTSFTTSFFFKVIVCCSKNSSLFAHSFISNKGTFNGKFSNQGCSKISSKEGLSLGSYFNIFVIKFLAKGLKSPPGQTIFTCLILLNNSELSIGLYPLKGNLPVNNSNNNTPNAHISTPGPWPFCSTISGAKYWGVPQNEFLSSDG